jgi:hypothetical protein
LRPVAARRRRHAWGSWSGHLAVILVREGGGELSGQFGVREDPCGGAPLNDDSVKIGVHIQLPQP